MAAQCAVLIYILALYISVRQIGTMTIDVLQIQAKNLKFCTVHTISIFKPFL